MGFWGVMFQVNPGQAALLLAQNLELILVVVLRRLVDNEIKRQVAHTLAGYLTHVLRQVKGWSSAPVASGSPWTNTQIPVMLTTTEAIEVTAVSLPSQYFTP